MIPYICAEINAKNSYGAYTGWKLHSGVTEGRELSRRITIEALGPELHKKTVKRQLQRCSQKPLFIVKNADPLKPYRSN